MALALLILLHALFLSFPLLSEQSLLSFFHFFNKQQPKCLLILPSNDDDLGDRDAIS